MLHKQQENFVDITKKVYDMFLDTADELDTVEEEMLSHEASDQEAQNEGRGMHCKSSNLCFSYYLNFVLVIILVISIHKLDYSGIIVLKNF